MFIKLLHDVLCLCAMGIYTLTPQYVQTFTFSRMRARYEKNVSQNDSITLLY